MKRNFILAAFLIVLLTGFLYHKPLATHLKIIFFLTEEFPQIPIKPLGLVSIKPFHNKVELKSKNGKIVADLYIPKKGDKHSAVILAMGVKTSEENKPLLMSFADTLSRLGYVAFWPRLEILDKGEDLPEEPETFIESFKYLATLPQTDSEKITLVGFSAGSSTSIVAASDPEIAQEVHAMVFFGGYYNVFDYLLALATKKVYLGEERISWNPAPDAIDHAKGLLKVKKTQEILQVFDATNSAQANTLLNQAPESEAAKLKKYSPHEAIEQFKANIFILHDKSDTYVPYTESIKLKQVLPANQIIAYHISDLFEHVQPNRPIKLGELFKLYGFLYEVFETI